MKSKIYVLAVMSLLSLTASCTKEKLENIDYFAFGSAHGFCQGDCADFFTIKDGNIYPDDMDYYTGSGLKFNSEPLAPEKYNLAKKLIDDFPAYLSKNPDKTFGCPDCADQGGFHIEINQRGQIKRWHFDTDISILPARIQGYVQEISAVIQKLK